MLVASPLFWKGRRVLVTGHTGFKGSWLCAWLALLGAEVWGYALAAEPNSHATLLPADSRPAQAVIGDIRDAARLSQVMQECQPEIVLHLAAQALVRESYVDPVGTWDVNVMGTQHLLEAIRRTPGVRSVVIVTSDKCYENREWLWGYREQDALGGHDPYSSSKAAVELLTASYRNSFFTGAGSRGHGAAIATARAGNVIGGGDDARDRLLPDLLRALAADSPCTIRNPHARRPWQHVLEPLHGYLLLAERLCGDPDVATAWNFGPDTANVQTVREVADRTVHAWGRGAWVDGSDPTAPHEATLLHLDSSMATARLGWRPVLNVSHAVEWTVEWTRTRLTNCLLTREQITKYSELATHAVS